jgi:ornithine cyclodeaminase
MKIVSVEALAELVRRHGLDAYIRDLMVGLRRDFGRWDEFTKMPRPAMHVPGGVIELMPICDKQYYTFKYVNGHPKNPLSGKMTVLATGQISLVEDGYPLMISEMTTLTGLRTAATSALATDLMARKDARVLAILGTGAQSEFQVRAAKLVRDLTTVRYFDIDPAAMDKFERNMAGRGLELVRCESAEEAVRGADIVTVVTACKAHVDVVKNAWVKPGVHINGLGGDCPGKTELEASIVPRARVVVEYFEQSFIEGEIQRWSEAEARELIVGELHELVTGAKRARTSDEDITLYDSVGIALEDYSALRLTYELVQKYGIGEELDMTPVIGDPKNLISVLEAPVAEAVAAQG